MENKKEVNIDHLRRANSEASKQGKQIASFDFYEISIVQGGGLEMGPISNIKYTDGTANDDAVNDAAHAAFLWHELKHK